MYRLFIVALLSIPLHALAGQSFDLNWLMKHANKHPAPPELKRFMAAMYSKFLIDCVADSKGTLKKPDDYFAAVELHLADGKGKQYLVFPAQFCLGMMGESNSLPYDIVASGEDEKYMKLMSSDAEKLKVLNKRTNGYRDIYTTSGPANTEDEYRAIYRFDGKLYRGE